MGPRRITVADTSQHVLKQSWPDFLDRLDSDPTRAFEDFYTFARTLLTVAPPRNLWELPDEQREDLIHDVVLDCCLDDYRVLRRYRNQGRPFASWFSLVARNRITDQLRRKREVLSEDYNGARSPAAPAAASPDRLALSHAMLEKVVHHIESLGDVCRLLLLGAAEGLKPRDLVRVLGWPDDWNKKASDDLRECRKRLRHRLRAEGLDLGDITAP